MRFALSTVIGLFLLCGVTAADAAGRPTDIAVFQFEQEARNHCPADAIVWVIRTRGIYDVSAERWYGRTSNGAYACLKDVEKAGLRASNEPR